MGKIENKTIDIGYPLYGAKFVDNHTLVTTGGGGEGNNGIPNKLTAVSVDFQSENKLKLLNDFEIEGKNDSPTSLDLAGETLLIGCNEHSENIKKGQNKHLRKFTYSKEKQSISFNSSVDVEKSVDTLDYQKEVSISNDGSIAAVLSSKIPGSVKIIDVATLKTIKTLTPKDDVEITDISISPNGSKVAYITEKSLVITNTQNDEENLVHNRFAPSYDLTKIKFISETELVIGINLKHKSGILLSHVVIREDGIKVIKSRVISEKTKKITSLDSTDSLVAVAGNDGSILIVGVDHFDVYKTLKNIHSFAITTVVFSPNGKYLASTSASNTLNVIEIPEDISKSYYWVYVNILVVLFAYIVYSLISRITPEQKERIDDFIRFMFDDPQTYQQEKEEKASQLSNQQPLIQSSSGSGEIVGDDPNLKTFSDGEYVVEVVTNIKEGDIVEVSTRTSWRTETSVYEDTASTLI
ncbi:Guanine nucleotide-exchange factor SEC12 [Wickerhamomyces ciferrii]|uniref:Guanine nucleotide-exchange factor SEC12 n=1 Tax=Wickerhamomyces ciferrii (strain ATCC 14091 / BCRC 22168 / CBS 111 / JCM 3599 / NBRC 0793 / NRRL Y-1031 F-60-10) TaxID=1206466 RepID=K0KLK3_WICCF|nr:Guanine nucleotide-exchange factor SEC12 [Wickerhamomyces ciferrii]CCH42003.1 Guanine nucleotide-exchange factor SEC12 [Wickerhamomyces ciferrii]